MSRGAFELEKPCEMAQPRGPCHLDGLRLIPGAFEVEGEKQLLKSAQRS